MDILRAIFSQEKQILGLIVLLLSKSQSGNKNLVVGEDSGVYQKYNIEDRQRKLAEITDMINISQIMHKSVVDLNNVNQDKELVQHNTISLLIGDYLLAKCWRSIAKLRNVKVRNMYSAKVTIINYNYHPH